MSLNINGNDRNVSRSLIWFVSCLIHLSIWENAIILSLHIPSSHVLLIFSSFSKPHHSSNLITALWILSNYLNWIPRNIRSIYVVNLPTVRFSVSTYTKPWSQLISFTSLALKTASMVGKPWNNVLSLHDLQAAFWSYLEWVFWLSPVLQ